MINKIYVVYDKIAQEAGPVFNCKNDDVAIRQTVGMLIDSPHLREDDYTLVCLAELNTESLEMSFLNKNVDFMPAFVIAVDLLEEEINKKEVHS